MSTKYQYRSLRLLLLSHQYICCVLQVLMGPHRQLQSTRSTWYVYNNIALEMTGGGLKQLKR